MPLVTRAGKRTVKPKKRGSTGPQGGGKGPLKTRCTRYVIISPQIHTSFEQSRHIYRLYALERWKNMYCSLSKVLKPRLASRLTVGTLTGYPLDQVWIFVVFSLFEKADVSSGLRTVRWESWGLYNCLVFSTMIRQLAVESLKRLFTSFFHEAFFHKSVSHVGWCHEQTPGANTLFSRVETVVIPAVNNNDLLPVILPLSLFLVLWNTL